MQLILITNYFKSKSIHIERFITSFIVEIIYNDFFACFEGIQVNMFII